MKVGVLALRIIKKNIAALDHKRIVTWPPFDTYENRLDIDVDGSGNYFHQIDVFYAPKEKRTGRTLIHIHGGGYIYGNRKNVFGFATVFLDKGYDVVLLDYEPNDGHGDVRGQVATLVTELNYVQDHAEELGLDPNKFFISGDSAGGHFALLLSEIVANQELSAQNGVQLNGIRFRAVAASCPVYNFTRSVQNSPLTAKGKTYMYGPFFKDEAYLKALNPQAHVDSLNIPVFVNTCFHDFLKQESFDLKEDLKERGKIFHLEYLDSQDKAINHVHNIMDIYFEESKKVNAAMDEFFQAALGE